MDVPNPSCTFFFIMYKIYVNIVTYFATFLSLYYLNGFIILYGLKHVYDSIFSRKYPLECQIFDIILYGYITVLLA